MRSLHRYNALQLAGATEPSAYASLNDDGAPAALFERPYAAPGARRVEKSKLDDYKFRWESKHLDVLEVSERQSDLARVERDVQAQAARAQLIN